MRALLVVCIVTSASLLAQSALERAVLLVREGRYADAQKAMSGVPEPADVNRRIAYHRLKAAIASGLKQPEAAVGEMRAALALSPNNPDLLLAVAVAEFDADQLEAALQHAEAAPESATRQGVLGDIFEKKGDHVAAAKAYETAVALAPEREQYRVAFALELIEHQSFQSAIEILQSSIALFPGSAKLRTLLGIAQYAAGYTSDAIQSLEAAVQADPKFDPPHRCLAEILLQSSAAPPQQATKSLCEWSRVVCSALQLRTAREQGNDALANKAIAELKFAAGDSAIGHCELGRAYEWKGRLEDARKEMESCVRLDPNPQNHYRLALLYRRLGEPALAHREMELRNAILQKMSEQTAVGMSALKGFDYAR